MGYAPLEPANFCINPVITNYLYTNVAGGVVLNPPAYTTVFTIQILQKLATGSAFNWHISMHNSGGAGGVWARLLLDGTEVLGEAALPLGWPPTAFDITCASVNFNKGSVIEFQVYSTGGCDVTYTTFYLRGEYSPFI